MRDDDLIRRWDAIAVLPGPRHDFAPYQDTVAAIRALPAVQPDAAAANAGLNLAIERVTAFLRRTDDAAHALAVDAMLEDMQNDNHEAEIRLYRRVILAMSDTMPGTAEAFPDTIQIFRRDRKMTFGDHVNHDPNDWQAYIRADAVQAQIDAAVKVERERIAAMIEATVYTYANNGAVRSLEPISPALVGMDMHHATIAAAIRNGDQP